MTIDLSLFGTPEGRKQLAATLVKAVREDGFFYVKNFNISQERVNRQFFIGKQLYEIPLEEKLKYVPEGLGMLIKISHTGRNLTSARQRRLQWLRACWSANVRIAV